MQRSKTINELECLDFDCVITLCGHVKETRPLGLNNKTKVIRVAFEVRNTQDNME